MKSLTKMEEMILASVFRLGEDAYGVRVQKLLTEFTDRKILYSTMYSTFEQLVRKGYISKHFGKPTAVRGGKRKVFFSLTDEGVEALRNALQTQKAIWMCITEESLQKG